MSVTKTYCILYEGINIADEVGDISGLSYEGVREESKMNMMEYDRYPVGYRIQITKTIVTSYPVFSAAEVKKVVDEGL